MPVEGVGVGVGLVQAECEWTVQTPTVRGLHEAFHMETTCSLKWFLKQVDG